MRVPQLSNSYYGKFDNHLAATFSVPSPLLQQILTAGVPAQAVMIRTGPCLTELTSRQTSDRKEQRHTHTLQQGDDHSLERKGVNGAIIQWVSTTLRKTAMIPDRDLRAQNKPKAREFQAKETASSKACRQNGSINGLAFEGFAAGRSHSCWELDHGRPKQARAIKVLRVYTEAVIGTLVL